MSLSLPSATEFFSLASNSTSFPPMPDFIKSISFFPKVGFDVVIFSDRLSSNFNGSANRESSESSHSASANSPESTSDLLYKKPLSISTSRVL